MATQTNDAAQNQHYVPKFMLRNFLHDEAKEQVAVFDRQTGRNFITNITGIMAERRFHDFQIDEEYIASFEDGVCRFEDVLLPTYRRVLADRRLTHTPEERAHLAMLVAFQFVRTRNLRDQFGELDKMLADKLEGMGSRLEDIEGWEPETEDGIKKRHTLFMANSIGEFAAVLSDKDMMLMNPADGRDFYISDNPVVLHNSRPAPPFFGNIGLGVKGIEVYLPLSSDLLLACFCPSILGEAVEQQQASMDQIRKALLPRVIAGQMTAAEMKSRVEAVEAAGQAVRDWWQCYQDGVPGESTGANMDFYNSLQLGQSKRFVISRNGDFALAKQFRADFPNASGRMISVN